MSAKRRSKQQVASRAKSTARGFDAGKIGRRLRAIPVSRVAINSQIRAYGKNVVARSRYLCANNPYAASAKEEFIAFMVGTGIVPSSQVKDPTLKAALQDAFAVWSDECDADSVTDFYGNQALVAGELFEGGECFVRFRERFASDGLSVPLQIQLLPTEMLPTDYNLMLTGGKRIECGIQFDAIGRREGYWFYTRHPGENFNFNLSNNTLLTFVPASEVIHLYRPMRAGQIRGIPQTLSGMITLAMLDLYDDAELERKRLAALFAAFIVKGLSTDDNDDSSPLAGAPVTHTDAATGQTTAAMEPGATIELDYGQDVRFSEPADVGGNYEAFQKRQLLKIAAGMGATYHGLTGDTSNQSFSTMRADQLRYRRRIEAQQFHIMIYQFCRRVWNRWMDAAVQSAAVEGLNARDYIKSPLTFQKTKWAPPKWDWVNPLQEVTAEKLAVDSGFKPRSAVIEGQGEDPIATDDAIAADQARAADKGIKFIALRTGVLVSPTEDDTPSGDLADPNAPAPGAPAPGAPAPGAPAPKPAPKAPPKKGT